MILLYIFDLVVEFIPLFTEYLIFAFAFIVIISIIKLVRYLINV